MESHLRTGSRILCKWNDGNHYPAEIIQEREAPDKSYYIHYLSFNKRLDQWVLPEDILPLPPGSNVQEESMVTRFHKRKREDSSPGLSESRSYPLSAHFDKDHEECTKVRNVDKIIFGKFEIQPWYYSPYLPKHYHIPTLYICEFCLKYMRHGGTYREHYKKCPQKKPSGKLIYRENVKNNKFKSISVFEIMGNEHKLYCQNLCLLAKLFLDHKTLYYYVSPFKFYVLTEDYGKASRIVGYFSKEIGNDEYNLACLLILPQYQQKGYGKFLIALSYELSKRHKKIGTPETPLSDMGRVSYRSYWTDTILKLIQEKGALSLKEISQETSILYNDVVETLNSLNMLKYWKGQYILNGLNAKFIEEYFRKKEERRRHSKNYQALFNKKLLVYNPKLNN